MHGLIKVAMVGALCLGLAACSTKTVYVPVETKIPVPVKCEVSVDLEEVPLDRFNPFSPLEEQNTALRLSNVAQAKNIENLKSGLVGCGGKVNG